MGDWHEAASAKVEVLSLGAAAIVRAGWKAKAIKEQFEFLVAEPAQLSIMANEWARAWVPVEKDYIFTLWPGGKQGERAVREWVAIWGLISKVGARRVAGY